jgi:ABC-type multidrug transport system permease subunit
MRFRLFYREPGGMFWTFGFPLLLSFVLGTAFRNAPPDVTRVAVELGDDTAIAERTATQLLQTRGIEVSTLPHAEASAALRKATVSVVVVPTRETFTLRFDDTRPEGRAGRIAVEAALQRALGRRDVFLAREDVAREPGARYIDFLVPGLIGFGLMSTGLWGIGFSLAEMRAKKLLKRLIATPMRRFDFLFSFLIVRAVLLVVELPPLLIFSHCMFDVQVRGSLATVFVIALIGGLTFAVMGLMLASRAENPQVVSGLINVVSFPMYLGSGVFFSSTRFPPAVAPVLSLLPLTALNDALRSVINEGVGLVGVAPRLAVVLVWGLGSFGVALRLFRWR